MRQEARSGRHEAGSQGNVKAIISMLSLRVPPLAGRSNPMQLIGFMGSPRRPEGLLAMTQWGFTDYDVALGRKQEAGSKRHEA